MSAWEILLQKVSVFHSEVISSLLQLRSGWRKDIFILANGQNWQTEVAKGITCVLKSSLVKCLHSMIGFCLLVFVVVLFCFIVVYSCGFFTLKSSCQIFSFITFFTKTPDLPLLSCCEFSFLLELVEMTQTNQMLCCSFLCAFLSLSLMDHLQIISRNIY